MTAAAAAAVPDASLATPIASTVDGTVLSRSGRPMSGVTLSIRPATSTRECLTCAGLVANTDSAGRFTLALSAGNYLVMCQFCGTARCRVGGETGSAVFTAASGARLLALVAEGAPSTGSTVASGPLPPLLREPDTAVVSAASLQPGGMHP